MEFYDVHAHKFESQKGGFLIGLDGEPKFECAMSSEEALAVQNKAELLFAVQYVGANFAPTRTQIVKYHSRREKYSPEQVIADIRVRAPRIVIIDTLNQPFWQPIDYWRVALAFGEIEFIFCHSGGYDIHEFLKIANFCPNVWLDFSLTQEYFGWCGNRTRYENVANAIDFALDSPMLAGKVLFGSDTGFFSQSVAVQKYQELENGELFLRENFFKLIRKAKIC